MATSKIQVSEGSGKNLATNSFTEDTVTKEVSRIVLNDSSGAEITTLPVSAVSLPLPSGASISANQQTDALTDTEIRATALPVSASALPLPTGASTSALQQTDGLTDTELRATAVPVSASALPLPTGASTSANQQSDALTDTEIRATALPVSASSLPLPAGASTSANQQTDSLTDTELRATPVPVSQAVAGVDTNSFQATITSADATTATQVKAKTTAKKIHVTSLIISTDTAMNLQLQSDNGTPQVVMEQIYLAANGGMALTFPDKFPLVVDTNEDLDIKASVSGNISVTITGYVV